MRFNSSAADIGNSPAGNTFKGQLLALSDAGNFHDDAAVSEGAFVPSEGILPGLRDTLDVMDQRLQGLEAVDAVSVPENLEGFSLHEHNHVCLSNSIHRQPHVVELQALDRAMAVRARHIVAGQDDDHTACSAI